MTISGPARISARLDESRSSKLAHLQRSTGLPVTEIVGRGIDLLFAEQGRRGTGALEILERTGFVGSGEGPGDLSERYKEVLTESFERRHREGYARHPVEDSEFDP